MKKKTFIIGMIMLFFGVVCVVVILLYLFEQTSDSTSSSLQIYKASRGGYSVVYPMQWNVVKQFENDQESVFIIEHADTEIDTQSKGATITIHVAYGMRSDGLRYNDFEIIDEIVNDFRFGLSIESKNKLSHISEMQLGGKTIRVFRENNATVEHYEFLYAGKLYAITYTSESEMQFGKNYKTFLEIIASLQVL